VPRSADFLLLSADYSQIELRILAALSQESALLAAFLAGEDDHVSMAAKVYGVPKSQVTPEMRDTAKMVNYGVSYGMSAFGLAQRLGISRAKAAAFIDKSFGTFPEIARYKESSTEFAWQTGYVQTVTGRGRYIPDINSRNATIRKAAERNAVNMPIQGMAADMIKLAMIVIHSELTKRSLKSRLLLQVHDELVFDLFKPEQDEVTVLVEEKMRTALSLDVPIEIQIGTGNNWLEAH
jgi:DNA polymerase-1